jgi:peptidoglycan hydrolase-like protein with peptidoglycan-binding domain
MLGYFPSGIQPTSYFGPITERAVINYQKAQGIPATGFVGPRTIQALSVSSGSASQPGTVFSGGSTSQSGVAPSTQKIIISLAPSSGQVGNTTEISIQGLSYMPSAANNFTIHFGIGGKSGLKAIDTGSSTFGSLIIYTIPSGVSGCDFWISSYHVCTLPIQSVTPGTYPVYITDANGNNSNTVYFTVNPSPNTDNRGIL